MISVWFLACSVAFSPVVAVLTPAPTQLTPGSASATPHVLINAEPPSHLWLDWANVTVNWTTSGDTADAGAWIGAFLAPWPATYVKWQASSAPSGSVTFRLLNARHPYVFRYFQGDDMIAESDPIAPLGRTPHQGHLSLIPGHDDRMALVWVSNSSEPQTVKWGASRQTLDHATAIGAVDTTTITSEAGLQNLGAEKWGSEGSRLAESERGVWFWFWLKRHSICTPHLHRKNELILPRGRKTDSAPLKTDSAPWSPGRMSTPAVCGCRRSPCAPRPLRILARMTFGADTRRRTALTRTAVTWTLPRRSSTCILASSIPRC